MSEPTDQPTPEQSPQANDGPSPATLALRAARGGFVKNFLKTLRSTPQGQFIIDPMQLIELLRDTELEHMRLSAMANVLVAKGLVDPEELAAECAKVIEQRNEELDQQIVLARMQAPPRKLINGG